MTHTEELKHYLRWLNGDFKEPNITELKKETVELILKELNENTVKLDNIKACLISCEIYLENADINKQSIMGLIKNNLQGI